MLSAVLAALRRVPIWLWLLLLVAGYAGYLHHRLAKAERLAENATEAAAKAAEAEVNERLKAYDAQSRAVEARVSEISRQSAAAAARTRQIEAGLASAQAAGAKLEQSGTVDEVVRFGRGLGYHPLPARRP